VYFERPTLAVIANCRSQNRIVPLLHRRPKWIDPLQASDCEKPDGPRFLLRVCGFAFENAVLSVRRYLKDQS
jgi:hypothetical protein